jgi:hypothetical protein
MEVFVGKVDGKLIEGIGQEVRFWDPGRSKRPMKVTKSSRQKHLLMCSLIHENNIDITFPVDSELEVAEMENGRF